MRYTLLIFLSISVALASSAQKDSTGFDKVMAEFCNIFLRGKDEPETSFYDQLYQATDWVLNMQNPAFRAARNELTSVFHQQGDSLLVSISDSVYKSLPPNVFWKDQQVDLIRFQKILELANDELCSCVNAKREVLGGPRKIWEIVSNCDTSIGQDVAYTARMKQETKSFGLNELKKVQLMIVKYMYANCPSFRSPVNSMLAMTISGNYYSYSRLVTTDLEKKIVRFYKGKKDSLSVLFADYANYKNDIDATIAYVDKKTDWLYRLERKLGTDIFIRTTTYYKEGKPSVILAQTVCEYEVSEGTLKINTFRFIPSDKIKNKAELLADIEVELPPPPRPPELKTVKPIKSGNN